MLKSLLILGAGGYGLAVAEAAELTQKWQEIIFVDDRWPATQQVEGYTVISNVATLNQLALTNVEAIVAVGNNELRQQWQQVLLKLGIKLATIVHPEAVVSTRAWIGNGVSIMAGCIVSRGVVIKDGVILNIGTLLDHDVTVESCSHLSVGVKVKSNIVIPANTYVAAGICIDAS